MLAFNPILAKNIGLNNAIFLSQLKYWIEKCGILKDSRYWVFRTHEEWHQQFQFWSLSTLRRVIGELEDKGLIESGNYNKFGFDKTKWYSITPHGYYQFDYVNGCDQFDYMELM